MLVFFLLFLIVPVEASFHLGLFRLTLYRLILIFLFPLCFFRFFKTAGHDCRTFDWLILFSSLWIITALTVNHGFSIGLESGGIILIESFGAYLLARSFIRNESEFSGFINFLVFIVIFLSFFTIYESLTGVNIFRPSATHSEARLGFVRAFGPFEHAILYGVFCASAVSLALYVPVKNSFSNRHSNLKTLWVIFATFVSVSSGALVSVIIQMLLVVWNRATRNLGSRWYIFILLIFFGYIFLGIYSNRPPLHALLDRFTFSSSTAYYRLVIWEWGMKHNVHENPWFGIGLGDWSRPEWMVSTSMDSFWLVIMVRYGLPSFALLAVGIFHLIYTVSKRSGLTDNENLMRTGWVFSMLGFIICGFTVHFWNSLHVWFFFMLGSGVWLVSKD